MIVVALVKEVDDAALAAGRVITVRDCWQIAQDLSLQQQFLERCRTPKMLDADAPPYMEWAELSPERQWEFFHRAMVAVQEFEASREARRAG